MNEKARLILFGIMCRQAQENILRKLAIKKIEERYEEISKQIISIFNQKTSEEEIMEVLRPLWKEQDDLVENINKITNPHLFT